MGCGRCKKMDLREIKYLLCIYRAKGITKAAEELYISQPALSKFLKNLEARIGAPLFNRLGNELVPTYLGERFIAYALEIERLQNDCEMECNDLLGEQRGQLSIAVTFMRSSSLLPEVLRRFYMEYPRVQVNLLEEARLLEDHMLSDKGVHLLLCNEPYSRSQLIYEEVGREEILLVAAADDPIKNMAQSRSDCRYPWIDLSVTTAEPFLLHPIDQTTGRIAREALQQAGVTTPHVVMETCNAGLALQLAASGMGLAFVPESYAHKICSDRKPALYSIGKPKTETILYVAYQKGRYLPSYALRFIAILREELARNAAFTVTEK